MPAISPRATPDTSPLANRYTNNLSGNAGDADIAFSDLNENLWSSGVDATYKLTPQITLGVGYAFTDTPSAARTAAPSRSAPAGSTRR
ncbi:hypothetical protein AB5I41_29135 [Sphingomonas sp. MMS24-JH45]